MAVFAILLVAILLFPSGGFAATSVGGRISTDTTWTLSGSPYIVTSSVQFYGTTSTPITLTIEPGVVVKFQTGTYLQIANGTNYPAVLSAAGTAGAPIIFTSYKDDTAGGDTNGDGSATSPAPGNWNYVSLWQGSSSSVLDHTEVRYGGGGGQGNIYVYGSSPTIQNSVITQSSSSGVLLTTASPTMTNVTVDQVGGDGISINGGSGTTAPVISQATISNAGRYGIYVNGSNGTVGGTIQGSTILTPVSYGLYINQGAPTFLNNSIDGSLFMTNQSGLPTFTDNTIRHFSTKTGRISIGILQQLQTQNTLLDIDPSTVLELNGTTVSTNTTLGFRWKIYNVVTGNITVSGTSPVTLTINPGVTLRFAVSSYLGVSDKGILSARGTSTEPILLTTLNPAPNNWRGIVFNGNAVQGASLLEYVTVDQGGKQDAAIYGSGTAFTLNHCTISNSSMHGIQLYSADLNMQFSRVYNNSQRGLYVPNPGGSSDNSRVTIRNSDFYSNTQGAILNEQSTLSVG